MEITLGKHNTENIEHCNSLAPSTFLKKLKYVIVCMRISFRAFLRFEFIIENE
jgi:hypothetical protein